MMRFRNTFNRVVIVIACLVLMAALVALFIFPGTILTAVGEWMLAWGQIFQDGQVWPDAAIGVLAALLVVFLLGLVIFWQLRSRRGEFVRVQRVNGGMAKVSTESAKEMLEHQLSFVPGVVDIESQVRARGNRVGVQVAANVVRGTNVPEAANQIIKETQRVFTDELGLHIEGAPEVSVTVVREEGAPERQESVAPSRQPTSYTAVPPAVESDDRAEQRQRQREEVRVEERRRREREAVRVEEEKTPVVPETHDREEQEPGMPAEQEAEDRWLYEDEERESVRFDANTDRTYTDRDYEEPIPFEEDEAEPEEDEIVYPSEGQRPVDPLDHGKETHTR
jgi:hypothetical protein